MRNRTLSVRFSLPGILTMLLRVLRNLLLTLGLPMLAACAAGQTGADVAPVAAVIIKQRVPAERDAVLRAMQATLGRDAGVRYVRPLAGDAHLIHLIAPATREQVPELLERLRSSGAFQYVELDSMMKVQ